MNFLVDAQLPPALARMLDQSGHTAVHVEAIGLLDTSDSAIWQHALIHQAIIVSKDEDFASRALQTRTGPVVVWLRIGNCSRQALLEWFTPLFPAILREIEAGHRLIEVR